MRDGDIFGGGDWRERLMHVVQTMREVSRTTDPQELVATYRARLTVLQKMDGFLSLTRRGVEPPAYLVARSSLWERGRVAGPSDPWAERSALPRLEGGLLGELFDAGQPRLVQDLRVDPDDPAAEHLAGMRSLVSIPVYDGGEALNLVVHLRDRPDAFDPEHVPQMVWLTNLFSRATHGLVLARELREAHAALDAEHAEVGALQRSFLPDAPPAVPGLDLAVHYRPSGRAGGDSYDFFPLPDGRWGILLTDVSGHGAPAAVLMAVTHALAHLHEGPADVPSRMLAWLNEHLTAKYTRQGTMFVTALYGVYDPQLRTFEHALAGHPPPRIASREGGTVHVPQTRVGLPLGVLEDSRYADAVVRLAPGDSMVLFTDGLTEARDPAGELFGTRRTDDLLARPSRDAAHQVRVLVDAADAFAAPNALQDDLTVIVGQVTD